MARTPSASNSNSGLTNAGAGRAEREPAARADPAAAAKNAAANAEPSAAWLRRAHFVARLSRAWDARFEAMARAGQIGRWYSAVGNECTTVGAALLLEAGD